MLSVFPIGGGRGYVTALQDGTVDVWDLDGNRLTTLGEPGTTLVDVAVAPDGNTVTTVDFFGVVRRWDIATVPPVTSPVVVVDGVGVVNSVAFAPDGSGVALATSSGLVETIDGTGAVIRSFDQPRGNVDSVAFCRTRPRWQVRWASGAAGVVRRHGDDLRCRFRW